MPLKMIGRHPVATKWPFHVMIVEDDTEVASFLQVVLTSFCSDYVNISSEIVGTVREGMTRYGTQPDIHVILLDLLLPNGTGLEVVRRFSERFTDIPIIVISGMSFTSQEIKAAGGFYYLSKPVMSKHLRPAIAEALGMMVQRRVTAGGDLIIKETRQAIATEASSS
jgi:two-component system response regulator AtoC